jgi:hypothetical protein
MVGVNPADWLTTRPQKVAFLGLGVSRMAYGEQLCATSMEERFDQVWVCNFGLGIYRHDAVWLMDDMRTQARTMPAYGYAMATHDKPIVTSTVYPEFPMAVRCPVEAIIAKIGDDFLNSTVAYAIAYAMTVGVKELSLYGCDFHYPSQERREEGGQCAAYLLGLARHFGMTFKLPQQTTLLSAYQAQMIDGQLRRPLYGFAVQPAALAADGGPPDATRHARAPLSADSGHHDGAAPEGHAVPAAVRGGGPADLPPGRPGVE